MPLRRSTEKMIQGFSHSLRRKLTTILNIPKRFKYKQKWATTRKKKLPTELALEHFDSYYKPVYKDLWPSMRLALLSQRKYAALVNVFGDVDQTVHSLIESGADDMLADAREFILPEVPVLDDNEIEVHKESNDQLRDEMDHQPNHIYDFMPVKRIISEKEEQRKLEVYQNRKTLPENEDIQIISDDPLIVPLHLKVFSKDKGNVQLFKQPSKASVGKGILDYYLLDGGSVLPVLALDLYPGCSVLDMCAAPGGKTLTMLQTLLPEHITCIDHSYARVGRLYDVINSYIPNHHKKNTLTCVHDDSIKWCQNSSQTFDRVLVDAPCFTDRHVLNSDESNMFKGGSIEDRLQIQNTQHSLLYWGIQKCNPGGNIVYSTCTLSPPQNDGIVHMTVQKILQDTDIEVVVQNTGHIAERFRKNFYFYDNCRFGQLVVPRMNANYGPTYFCKLKRLN